MAKDTLPTNFKDDILASGMSGKRRYNMIQNSDGTVSFDDVTDYTQVGSTFGAAQINATNKAVNNAADASKIIDSLETIKANTQSGYIAGALAVKELNSNLSTISFNFKVSSATNASESISLSTIIAAPLSGYYKRGSFTGFTGASSNLSTTWKYLNAGEAITLNVNKSSGVQVACNMSVYYSSK